MKRGLLSYPGGKKMRQCTVRQGPATGGEKTKGGRSMGVGENAKAALCSRLRPWRGGTFVPAVKGEVGSRRWNRKRKKGRVETGGAAHHQG